MKLAWAFFKRDAMIEMSYRTSFAVQLIGNLLVLGVFYFIGKMVGDQKIPSLETYNGNYLAFMLIGIALTDCVGVSLTAFAKQIREGQLTGTLEATLMSPVPLSLILIYSTLWSYTFSAIRFVLYIVLGAIIYSVSMGQANLTAAIVVFLLTVICFAGIGMMWAAVVMLVKRGDSIMTMMSFLVILMSGVFFPSSMLPSWLAKLSWLIPLTHSLQGMRLALLNGYSVFDLGGTLSILVGFAVVLMTIGLLGFSFAVELAKSTGSLTEY
jgi:ABC-2 type transport system permease protein